MNKLSKFALLATSVAALCIQTASAASSYNPGDLLVSFRATGTDGNADQTYTVTIGAATTYRDATSGINVVTNIDADLTAAFGANWDTRSDIFWGIVGNLTNAPSGNATNGDPVRTIYASNDQTTLGVQSTPATISASGTRGTVAGNIQTFGNAFDTRASATNPNGSIISTSTTNNYTVFGTDSALDFGSTFGGNGIEANSALGVTNTALDLYRILNANPGVGSYEGTFVIDDSGNIAFRTTAAPEVAPAVPEPISTGLLTTCAFLGMVAIRRRKNAVA
jgi:hypothetical protein